MWTESERLQAADRWAGRLALVAPDVHKAVGLATVVPGLRVLTGTVAGVDGVPAEAVAALEAVGAEVSAVVLDGDRNTTRALLQSDQAAATLRAWGAPPVIVFRPEAESSQRLAELGCATVGANPRIARRLENKRAFRALCKVNGLPVVSDVQMRWPPGRENRAVWESFDGQTVVVQTARGFAGRRTWLWQVGGPLPPVPSRLAGRPVLVAPFVDGPTWTVNAVADREGVRVGPPMRQITGDARLTSLPLSSCGVAIAPPGAPAIAGELVGLAKAVGVMAAEAGFVGFFGIDAVGEPGQLRLVEMNARLTATLTVATLAEREAGWRPLIVDHVFRCLGEVLPRAPDIPAAGLSGGHVIVREAPGYSASVPALGEYAVTAGGLSKVGDDAGWPKAGHVSLWPGGPAWGNSAEDRARVLFSEPMMLADGRLTPFVEDVIAGIVRAKPPQT